MPTSLIPSLLMKSMTRSRFTSFCAGILGFLVWPLNFFLVRFSSSLIKSVPSRRSSEMSWTLGVRPLFSLSFSQLVKVDFCSVV